MSSRIAVILGAGPGLSASVARKLLPTHNLVLLSRSMPGSLSKLELNAPEASVLASPSDGSRDSLDKAIAEAKARWPDAVFDVGVFNVGGNFRPGPFLEKSQDDLKTNLNSGVVAAWNFAQVLIPLFLNNEPSSETGAKANLVFTGATMALRGSSKFGHMAASMFGRRAISQSLAKEFGPQGIHVSHVVVDGVIDTGFMKDKFPEDADKRLDPDEVAQTYLSVMAQHKSAWTQELDIRPYNESW